MTPTPQPLYATGSPPPLYASDPGLSSGFSYALQNCSPKYQNTSDMVDKGRENIERALGALKVDKCEYEKTDSRGGGAVISPFVIAAGGGSSTTQKSTGCEQVNVVSNIYNQCTSRLTCMLTQASNTQSNLVKIDQTIRLRAGNIVGSTIDLSTKNEVKMNVVSLTQQKTQSAITSTIEQGIKDGLQQSTDQSNEAFSDPNAQKQVAQLTRNIQSVTSTTNIQNIVTTLTNKMEVGQVITVDVGDIINSKISLSTENAISLVAQSLVYNTLDQLLNTQDVQETVSSITQTSAQENKGVPLADANKITSSFTSGLLLMILLPIFLVVIVVIVGVVFGPKILQMLRGG